MPSRTRREFLQVAAGALSAAGPLHPVVGTVSGVAAGAPTGPYTAEVPDTLDLCEMAHLGLNGLTGCVDPDHEYEAYVWVQFDSMTPYMLHAKFAMDCQSKWWESFPYLRLMTGSSFNRDIEDGFTRSMLNHVAEDGLCYAGWPHMSAWHEMNASGTWHNYPMCKEPFAPVLGNARAMLAMMAYYQQDNDPVWRHQLQRTSDGLVRIAEDRGDYAYFPDGSCGTAFSHPLSGWKNRTEPPGEHYGGEGSVLCYYGQVIRALTRWATLSGDEKALDHASKLVNFCQNPKMWAWEKNETPPRDIVVAEQAHFQGHVHGHLAYLRGLLEFAVATDNSRLKEFARSGYEYARAKGLARIGCFGEGCSVADMIALAIRLSDAGLGDYWDDVSRYVRNQFVEMQFSDPGALRTFWAQVRPEKVHKDAWDLPIPGLKTTDRVFNRAVGTFSQGASPVAARPSALICCIGNCTNAIYYAWEGILRTSGDSVRVNLLLNRASAALDVASYLPYQGKVTLKNKTARSVTVRMPFWVDRKSLRFDVNAQDASPIWAGNYVVFAGLRPDDTITITFPLTEESNTYSLDPGWWYQYYSNKPPEPRQYRCSFRGDTCVAVSGTAEDSPAYLLYRTRDRFRNGGAPIKQVSRFVAPKIYNW